MTAAEKTLWLKLRSRRLEGYKFRRQTSIAVYMVDFHCASRKLIAEIDGDVHEFARQQMHDCRRQRELQSLGFRLLRFTNQDVRESLNGVLQRIIEALGE